MQIELKRSSLQKLKFVGCMWPDYSSLLRQAKEETIYCHWFLTTLISIFFLSLPWQTGSVSVAYCLGFANETMKLYVLLLVQAV